MSKAGLKIIKYCLVASVSPSVATVVFLVNLSLKPGYKTCQVHHSYTVTACADGRCSRPGYC